ncbi:type II secretion system protein [Acetivibrio clariflavus]|uniref:type II secretion system protein n=1 Tax=Acetivibrio clariflavus TaxID=288965 RepID=UPI000481CEF1|nr:prepilin-type N-terminal cleavage/methylation domain-containing protein [Acetivibrio clariflavus]
MKRLLRSEKGLTFIEVLIALSIMGLLSVPIMMMFMNAQMYARKVDKQTEINAVTRTVKELVLEGLNKDAPLSSLTGEIIDIDGEDAEDGEDSEADEGEEVSDGFKSIIRYAIKSNTTVTTPYLKIEDSIEDSGNKISDKYTYTVTYDPAKYYDSNYKGVYNVLIKIYEKESKNKVNELKVSVYIDNLYAEKKTDSEDSESD